ncbi:hypothetical protein Taro_001177, partial [Colocasia esculenta]|nr:hypothetical protein [Colocasia esculenta]
VYSSLSKRASSPTKRVFPPDDQEEPSRSNVRLLPLGRLRSRKTRTQVSIHRRIRRHCFCRDPEGAVASVAFSSEHSDATFVALSERDAAVVAIKEATGPSSRSEQGEALAPRPAEEQEDEEPKSPSTEEEGDDRCVAIKKVSLPTSHSHQSIATPSLSHYQCSAVLGEKATQSTS